MSVAERASEASSAEQANSWMVRANKWTEEQMAQYSTRRFPSHSTHSGLALQVFALYAETAVLHKLDWFYENIKDHKECCMGKSQWENVITFFCNSVVSIKH